MALFLKSKTFIIIIIIIIYVYKIISFSIKKIYFSKVISLFMFLHFSFPSTKPQIWVL
jgi:hypothetical protein